VALIKKGNAYALLISGFVIGFIVASLFFTSGSGTAQAAANPRGSASVVACNEIEDLFLNVFNCCGSGAGSGKCFGIETANDAAACPSLSCGPFTTVNTGVVGSRARNVEGDIIAF